MVGSSLGTRERKTERKMAKKRVPRKIKAEGVLSWIGTPQARRPDGRDARTAHAARPKAAGSGPGTQAEVRRARGGGDVHAHVLMSGMKSCGATLPQLRARKVWYFFFQWGIYSC